VNHHHCTYDAIVIGAGPAGCAAAISLAQTGRSVALCDKARFPRDKTCGDGLTTGALRRLESLGLDEITVSSFRRVDALAVRAPSGRQVLLPFRRGPGMFAAVARRFELDAALVARARSVGANVFENARFQSLRPEGDDSLRVRLDGNEELRGHYIVGADGAWSEVRRAVVGPTAADRRPEWMAWRGYEHGTDRERTAPMWVWFARDLLPGYAWSFPLADGSVNVGVATVGLTGKRLADSWRSTLDSPFFRSLGTTGAALEAPARAWPIPARLDLAGLTELGGRLLFVGDAAGAADPFTGEGIGQALQTGSAAADAIIRFGTASSARVAERYSEAIAASLAKDHQIARACRLLFRRAIGADVALLLTDSSAFARRNMARWLFEDYPRAVIAEPSQWGEARRAHPGAYAREPFRD
jgi:menaquinone-9 beta-reductase